MLPDEKVIYNLGSIDRIPAGEGRTFLVENTAIAIFHARDGKLYATQASCPHKGGPLSDGLVGSGKVICPLHAYTFDLSTGTALNNACSGLMTYAVTRSDNGEILLNLE
ncbi:Rieske (2Fe-2S) protein [Ktedonosporobacter rubrisoli]|uniref:Rieske (2Fe-2S) protein n=2 Tax=Ktedonosporobacter rubrisoli TaxID=2509675 RepID=A0A4P6K6Z2_KTERU|nr:Rieske (2Fe-2S) protein [Ktedonosporobacter rubrisoli]